MIEQATDGLKILLLIFTKLLAGIVSRYILYNYPLKYYISIIYNSTFITIEYNNALRHVILGRFAVTARSLRSLTPQLLVYK